MGILAQDLTNDIGTGLSFAALMFWVAFWYAVAVVPFWMIFEKAGREGWRGIIPIYNYLVLLEIVGRPWWWILLYLIPIVNIVILVLVMNDLSKSFGHGTAFTLGLIFLNVIFFYILAFNSDRYLGPAGAGGAMGPPPSQLPPPPPPPVPTA